MGNSRSKHERLADETDAGYFKKVERRNRVKTQDMTFNPTNAKKKGNMRSNSKTSKDKQSTKPEPNARQKNNESKDVGNNLGNVPEQPTLAAASVRYRSNMFRQAEEKPLWESGTAGGSTANSIPPSLSLKSSNFSPSPEKNIRKSDSRDKKGKHNFNRITSPLPLPSPPGSSKLSTTEARRKLKAAEENQKFDESVKSGGILQKEITRSGKVTAVSWSPKLKTSLLAVGTDDGFVAIIDASANENETWGFSDNANTSRREFPREGKIRSLSWSADGSLLAIGGDDCTAAVVDIESMQIIHELEREDRVYEVSFSPDMEFLVIGGFDGMVIIVSLDSFEVITEIPMQGLVLSLCWSPDSSLLAVSTSDKNISIFDCDGWELASELEYQTTIDKLKWSPNGSLIALGGQDGSTIILNIENGESIHSIKKENCRINTLCWNGDGSFLCIAGSDKVSSIYEAKSFELVHEISRSGSILCSDWKATGFLAIGGDDRMIAILKSGPSIIHEAENISQQVIDQSQTNPQSLTEQSSNLSFPTEDFNDISFPTEEDNNLPFPTDQVEDISFLTTQVKDISSPNGELKGISFPVEHDKDISFQTNWDDTETLNSSKQISPTSTPIQPRTPLNEIKEFEVVVPKVTESEQSQTKTSINAVAISNNIYFMASGGSDGGVLIYSTDTWDVVMDMNFSGAIRSLLWSNTDEYLIIFTEGDPNVYIAQIGEPQWDIVAEFSISASPYSSGWSMADQMLAIGSSDGALTIADTTQYPASSWALKEVFEIGNGCVVSMDWSKNGKYLAAGCNNKCIILDADALIENTFQMIIEIMRDMSISAVAFGAGGNFLAIGGTDCNIAIYRTRGEWNVYHEVEFTSSITSIQWSIDGRYLAAGGETSSNSYQIFDTVSWEKVCVSEDHFELADASTEHTISLDWSDDGKWLVIGGSTGNIRVIDVELMEVAYLIERGDDSSIESEDMKHNYDDEHDYVEPGPGSHFIDHIPDGNTSVANMSDANSILEDLASVATPKITGKSAKPVSKLVVTRWTHRDEPRRFLEIVEEFLSPYEYDDPPQILRVFVACTLMLQWHVKWLDSHAMIVDVLSLQDDGQPMNALCDVLVNAYSVMEEIIQRDENIYQWWDSKEKFGLTNRDVKQLSNWNSWWEQVDVDASLVDCNLLCRLDQEYSPGAKDFVEGREDNYDYDQSEHVSLPTKGRRSGNEVHAMKQIKPHSNENSYK